MNFSTLVLSISEAISHMTLQKNITKYNSQSNDLTTKLTKLFESYSTGYFNENSDIMEDLKRISGLICYLKSCIYILESGEFDRWRGFRNKGRELNRIKVISAEIDDIIDVIEKDLQRCENDIKKYKLYPLRRTKAYSL